MRLLPARHRHRLLKSPRSGSGPPTSYGSEAVMLPVIDVKSNINKTSDLNPIT
jgi:hypothetical protein